MERDTDNPEYVEQVWRTYLTTGDFETERKQRQWFKMLPGHPRCKICYAPFKGIGSGITRILFDKHPSNLNPRLCNACESFAKEHQGGAEVELSLLFVDIRGSSQMAERMSPKEFSRHIDRFYTTATDILTKTDGLIDKIIGDQVAAMYVPGFAGSEHAARAIRAAQEIMAKTGHGRDNQPWISLGAGVHTGVAFVGSLGRQDGTRDITVLGDDANIAARLSTEANPGEILISETAYSSAKSTQPDLPVRRLSLKGRTQGVDVRVLTEFQPAHS